MNWLLVIVFPLLYNSSFLNKSASQLTPFSMDSSISPFPNEPSSESLPSHVMVFRNTGIVKSAVACQITTETEGRHPLSNKSILEFPSGQEKLKLTISLEKFTRSYNFNLSPNDTLYLEVYFSNGPGGALPSSRIRPNLKRLPPKQAKALWKEKWARRYFENTYPSSD